MMGFIFLTFEPKVCLEFLDERVRMLRRSREELCGQHDMLCHLLQARSRRVREWEMLGT